MNLIEALKKANGKPVRRRCWAVHQDTISVVADSVSLLWSSNNSSYVPHVESLLADDWYVVVEKSKIEEAIELEMESWYKTDMENIERFGGTIPSIVRRIVNLTLDEAKKAVEPHVIGLDWHVSKAHSAIDALKVKE